MKLVCKLNAIMRSAILNGLLMPFVLLFCYYSTVVVVFGVCVWVCVRFACGDSYTWIYLLFFRALFLFHSLWILFWFLYGQNVYLFVYAIYGLQWWSNAEINVFFFFFVLFLPLDRGHKNEEKRKLDSARAHIDIYSPHEYTKDDDNDGHIP